MAQATMGAEVTALLRYLDSQRNHALRVLEGLDEEALRRPVLPSGWSCLGLIQHLALDIERFWFHAVVAGDQPTIESMDGIDNAWNVDAEITAEEVFSRYRTESERSNAIIAATSLDAAPIWWPADLFGDFRLHTVREIVLHVITEVASHTGHLDVVRELIDGKQWLVLTE